MAPQQPGPCKDCHAWGVVRKHKWLCWGCRWWRNKFTRGTCVCCRREITVNDRGACRLCWRQAASLHWTKAGLSLTEANRYGQQLFLANLLQRGKRAAPPAPYAKLPPRPRTPPRVTAHRQLALLDLPRNLPAGLRAGFPPPPDPEVAEFLLHRVRERARKHGWGSDTAKKVSRGIAILLALQDTPGAPIPASLINQLPSIHLTARLTREFLEHYGLVEDDSTPAADIWFDKQISGLPESMTEELRLWWTVLRDGHATVPRSRPRHHKTARIKLHWAMPALQAWADQGIKSLRQISRVDVLALLPVSGNDRYTLGMGLRSIFKVLKGHKVVFIDPTATLRLGKPESRQPLPADMALMQEGLSSPDPTRAAMTALLAFHGLTSGELRALHLTDIRDGRAHLSNRSILLAEPVRVRLAAYLHYRNQRWPLTGNPHLFIHRRTALGTQPVGPRWPALVLRTAARDIRTDRILDEVRATNGDLHRICALFGMSVAGAARYTAILNHPGLTRNNRTH
ncbi:hypothetical protein ACFQ68_08685 [Amycolatopsis japonica]|uniref:hypothetical protein n=1 Tax=Amycolatopsis japonica TaxID=208439 RepID=UPI00366B9F47